MNFLSWKTTADEFANILKLPITSVNYMGVCYKEVLLRKTRLDDESCRLILSTVYVNTSSCT
jgi:hypothetical protein